jgi:hypothetical protein
MVFHKENDLGFEFILKAIDGNLQDIMLEFDNYKQIKFPGIFENGDIIKYSGGSSAQVFNKNWQVKRHIPFEPMALKIGEHTLTLDCTFIDDLAKLKIEVRLNTNTNIIELN